MARRPTKAQQAKVEEAYIFAALRWPKQLEPAPMAPDEMAAALAATDTPARAWTFNAPSKRVTHGCFSSAYHSDEGAKTTTQTQGGPWFSTEADARLAMRWAVCRRMARELRELELREPTHSLSPTPAKRESEDA